MCFGILHLPADAAGVADVPEGQQLEVELSLDELHQVRCLLGKHAERGGDWDCLQVFCADVVMHDFHGRTLAGALQLRIDCCWYRSQCA